MGQIQKTLDIIYGSDLDDNTVGDTTNENIRNAVETLRTRFGELYLGTPVTTTIATAGVYVKVAGTTLLSTDPPAYGISMPENNRLQYNGASKAYANIWGLASIQLISGVNQEIALAIAKNGTIVQRSVSTRLHSATTDIGRVIVSTLTEVITGDYFEIFVANNTSDADLIAQKLQIVAETKAIGL